MRQAAGVVLCLLATFYIIVSGYPCFSEYLAQEDKESETPLEGFTKLKRGMTPEQVRQLMGTPKNISRQILYHRYREQWLYETPFRLRLTFDCPRGRKRELLSLRVADKTEAHP